MNYCGRWANTRFYLLKQYMKILIILEIHNEQVNRHVQCINLFFYIFNNIDVHTHFCKWTEEILFLLLLSLNRFVKRRNCGVVADRIPFFLVGQFFETSKIYCTRCQNNDIQKYWKQIQPTLKVSDRVTLYYLNYLYWA